MGYARKMLLLSLWLLILIVRNTLIGTIAAIPLPLEDGPLERINIPQEKLKQMCDLREETLYKNILSFDSSLGVHLSYFFKTRSNESLVDEGKWRKQNQYECEKDAISKLKLQRLLNTVQLCMEETDRVEYDEDPKFVARLLKELCKLYSQGGRRIPDVPCIKTSNKQQHVSRRTIIEIDTILLPLIYDNEKCSEVRTFFDCLEDEVRNNETGIKNELKTASNILFYSLYGCNDSQPFVEAFSFNEVPTNIQSLSRNKRETVLIPLTISRLRQKCELKGSGFLENFDNAFEEFKKRFVTRHILISFKADLFITTDRLKPDNPVNQNCCNDPDMKETFAKLSDAMQDCMDVQERVNFEENPNKFSESLKIMCYIVDSTFYLNAQDKECFMDINKMYRKVLCGLTSSLGQLPSEDSKSQVCNVLYEKQNCEVEIFDTCKQSSQIGIRRQYNEMRKFVGCNNLYEI